MKEDSFDRKDATDHIRFLLSNCNVFHNELIRLTREVLASTDEEFEEFVSGTWNRDECNRFYTEDFIKEFMEHVFDDVSGNRPSHLNPDYYENYNLIIAGLVRTALDNVNWKELAEHYLEISQPGTPAFESGN